MPRFTEDDEGKTVLNPVDEEVGIVQTVEDGVAYVDPHPDITDRIKADLGWGDDPGINEYPLADEDVEEVTDDHVRLRQDLSTDQSGI